jgi:hypothetical protein
MYRRLDLNRRCGRMAGLHGLQKQNKKQLFHHNYFTNEKIVIDNTQQKKIH